jgi:hypothetical protein
LKNGAKIGIKIEKEGKWGKRIVRPFFDIKSGATFACKKGKGQALNFWRLNFFK